jgi:hypothetical protein
MTAQPVVCSEFIEIPLNDSLHVRVHCKNRRPVSLLPHNLCSDVVGDKIREFLKQLRHLRIFIAIWNVVVLFLMVLYVDALIYHIHLMSAWWYVL